MLSARGRLSIVVVTVVVSCVSAFAFGVGVAVAAAPEAPLVEVQRHTDTSAFFHGVLNPGVQPPQEGTYEFLYAASSSTCTGERKGARGLVLGFGGQEVGEEVGGLSPHSTYTVCLVDRNLGGEEVSSASKTFTTSFEPEAPETGAADASAATTAVLHGVLNPKAGREQEPGSFEFVYRRSANGCEGEGAQSTGQLPVAEYGGLSGKGGTGQEKEAVEREVTGLAPGTQYTVCLRAWNGTGQSATGAPVTFTTQPAKPSIGNEVVSNIGVYSASVTAEINSNGLETTYSVEYGTTSAYGSRTEAKALAGGALPITVAINGLAPVTEYHFRFVVSNELGSETGPDMTFTTYPTGSSSLPDGRVYEMVTPLFNHDADVYELSEQNQSLLGSAWPFQAAPDGETVAYIAEPTVGGNGATGNGPAGNEYLARRNPQGGWTQADVTPLGSNRDYSYQGFSEDLSTGFISEVAEVPFVSTTSLEEPVGTGIREVGLYAHSFDEPVYRPLTVGTPPYRKGESQSGTATAFGASRRYEVVDFPGSPIYAGSSVPATTSLFIANDDLLGESSAMGAELNAIVAHEVEEAQAKKQSRAELRAFDDRDELYASEGEHVELVNVLPDGKVDPGATFGGQPQGLISSSSGPTPEPDFAHDISADGSRIFWGDLETAVVGPSYNQEDEMRPGPVYVRENGERTVAVSEGPAEFWTASTDGRYAYYTEAGELWRFDVQDETRIELAGAEGGVQGVVGTNASGTDGAYLYFVAQEALSGAGSNSAGQAPVKGQDNLYGYVPQSDGSSRLVFVGALSTAADWTPQLGKRVASLTPDGHALTFVSSYNLTGRRYAGEGSEQVYAYDASDGSLVCASCRPQASGGHMEVSESLVYSYRRISADGDRVFFVSTAPLVARDVNGVQDVYEWERDGSGGCEESTGCVYLLSNGVEGAAYFMDASVSGDDAFIITRQRLVPEDQNENTDLYDARVDGYQSVSPPLCSGTACQGAPEPAPIFATPASVTFAGVGNFPPPPTVVGHAVKSKKSSARAKKLAHALALCHRQRARRTRARCERRARTAYGATKRPAVKGAK